MRLSETGPTATAFWRGALAVPFLLAWAVVERRATHTAEAAPAARLWDRGFLLAGFFFAGDLALWHWSLLLTSVAASTLEANLAPVVVTMLAWLVYRERPRPLFLASLGLALLGILAIVSPKLGAGELLGDLLGLATAAFYASYLLVVARLRARFGTGILMLQTTLVFSVLLLPLALSETFLPQTAEGWAVLFGLAFIAQCLGQGLIAYALAHLPATAGSVGLCLQPVVTAWYAWVLLGERLEPVQMLGGVVVLVAIALARASITSPARQ